MAVVAVRLLPDPVLITPAEPVGAVGTAARRLATDLLDTMAAAPACVGLAAPQIGVGVRAFAVDVSGHRKARSCHGPFVVFDPVVSDAGPRQVAREGCLSVPDLTGDVARPVAVTVTGLDPDARREVLHVDAFEARAVLHELDHLDGLVFLDRVAGPHAVFPRKVYR